MMNISVILPYYKRFELFEPALAYNVRWWARGDGIEIQLVLVLDEPTEIEEVLKLAGRYPLRWKIIVNRRDHPWRNPAKALNVGIRHSELKYCLIISPETLLLSDVPRLLMERVLKSSDAGYAFGQTLFDAPIQPSPNPYRWGSLFAVRQHLLEIRGYDETAEVWGGDDDNIRLRLGMHGLLPLPTEEARLFHPGHPLSREVTEQKQRLKNPARTIANDANWGKDFEEVIFRC